MRGTVSFTNLAPIEKTENLIYSILPISFGTWFVSRLTLADPLANLGAVIAITSFLSLLLYELPFDQWLLNGFLRWKTRRRRSLSEALLIFDLLERRWENELKELKDFTKRDFLEYEIARQVEVIVKNPYVRMEAWRIRVAAWFVPSLWFIIFAASTYFNRVGSGMNFDTSLLWIAWITLAVTISIVTIYLHRNITSYIDHLCRYSYLDKMIGLEQLEQPGLFASKVTGPVSELDALKRDFKRIQNQLSIVSEHLKVGDWSLFLDRWDGIYHWLHRKVAAQVVSDMAYYLVKPVSDYYEMLYQKKAGNPVNEASQKIDSQRELDWICYYYDKCKAAIKKRQEENKPSKTHRLTSRFSDKPMKKRDVLPLPEFAEEHDQLKERVCKESINFDDFDLLPTYSSQPSKMTKNSVGSAVAWAFGFLAEQAGTKSRMQEAGLLLLLKQYERNDLNLSLATTIGFVLSAFKKDGLGGSVGIENSAILKGLEPFALPEFLDNWAYAVARFIKALDKDGTADFISDGDFVIRAGKAHPDILRAIEGLVTKDVSTGHLRELIRRIKES